MGEAATNDITISRRVFFALKIVLGITLAIIWWQSMAIYGGKCYDLGIKVERATNPARQFIEDGRPFIWYKGTYYHVQYVSHGVFRAQKD